MNITIHQPTGVRTFAIGLRLDVAGDPGREIGPDLDGPWRARFSTTTSGYQVELYADEDRTQCETRDASTVLEVERPRHLEPGDVLRAGLVTITIGYQVEQLPPAAPLDPRERQLLAMVAADLADDAPRHVLADYWLERDDLRGALIHAQCAGDTAAAATLLAEHGATWLEPLRLAGLERLRFERGFVPSLVLGKEPLAIWPGLYRLSPVTYEIAMRRESHVSHQHGLVTMPATRHSALESTPVALKYSMNAAADFIARERTILELLHGPHLAHLLDVAHGRLHALVFADEPRLYRLLKKFEEPAAIELGIQLADALVELHALGIVHGEVDPAHITLAHGNAALHDFAMARGKQPLPPLPAGILGPHISRYPAPEQVGAGRVERASDVWALAMLLAHLVLGRYPVRANDDYHMLLAIRSGDVTVPKTVSGLGAVLATVLVADPASRPSAAVFREALAWVASEAGYPTGPQLLSG